MTKQADYYTAAASEFFAATVNVDMATLRGRFLNGLPIGASLLDAGCGSGRDARAFAEAGFNVSAFDASAPLAELASVHCGFEVRVRRFEDVDEIACYDGIWCCASLLHVAEADLPGTFERLWKALRPGGRIYVSFKLGTGQRSQGERSFTDADETRVRQWFAALSDVDALDIWITDDQRPGRLNEKWTNAIAIRASRHLNRLVTGGRDPFLPHLSAAIAHATHVDLAVAFIKVTGLRLLMPDLQALIEANGKHRVRVLTSDYLDVTDPEALRLLRLLQAHGADVRVYVTNGASFHLKAYILARQVEGSLLAGTAFIGSSNISRQALREGLEWNYRVVYPNDHGFLEAREQFDRLFSDQNTEPLSDTWIEAYERRRAPPPLAIAPGSHEQDPPPVPTVIQQQALAALRATREAGYRRGLVVLATGLGKTWLAAFDATAIGARRVLFIAHREEILSQAAATFQRILPGKRIGYYLGGEYEIHADVLCASVQTLARSEHLNRFAAAHFDYVVVDEFHHAAAVTYRRLLAHFQPAFLLGLTATPERSDQSDILSLCDDNLVYGCPLFEGIEHGLLSPFHYYGIGDDEVDYREVPWRNGRFDPEQLSNKLATLARARHALREWRARGQQRTLAFCVSIRHAEFMADQFVADGVAAAAVYGGSGVGRAEALEGLQSASLSVVFSVDLFNEGVDLPGIDTVMLLRPTESKILFLQQLGRGLRRSAGKQQLVVLDFIGNHRSFLQKPQALFGIAPNDRAIAAFARQAQQQALKLPAGCFVNYDLRVLDFMKSLDGDGPRKNYEALRDALGRRPSLSEFYRSGASVADLRRQHGHWFALVADAGDATKSEEAVSNRFEDLLREIETSSMTRSFKMVLLNAWLELDGLSGAISLRQLAAQSKQVIERRRPLLSDLDEAMRTVVDTDPAWLAYWRKNPVAAWIGESRDDNARRFFQLDGDRFSLRLPVSVNDIEGLSAMMQELIDYRLASYEGRQSRAADEASSNLVQFPARRTSAVELPYFPNLKIACGHFRTGRVDVQEHRALPPSYGRLDPKRHFIARAAGHSMDGGRHPVRDGDYLLLELIDPTHAGSLTRQTVAIERQDQAGDNQYLLRVVTKSADGQYWLKANNPAYEDLPATDDMHTLARLKQIIDPLELSIGQAFMREDIPALFGESFNPGNWQSGHVVFREKKVHVLLVTLNKQGKAEEHQYFDHWIDADHFYWQSQNATTPESTRGQEIIDHARRGIAIHLFVRDSKLAAGKAAPFTYYGQAYYQSHTGSAPMSVTFRL